MSKSNVAVPRWLGVGLVLVALALFPPGAAADQKGGISALDSEQQAPPGEVAALVRGRAIAPQAAPPAIRKVIAAANRIRNKPYLWGGGHGRWWSRGYDCSGAVSYALRGAKLIDLPLDSRSLMRWGEPGEGSWITVYTNPNHAYAVIAGLRWDTAGNRPGISGPRWHLWQGNPRGFAVRHPAGY